VSIFGTRTGRHLITDALRELWYAEFQIPQNTLTPREERDREKFICHITHNITYNKRNYGTFVPRNFRSQEPSFPETFVPMTDIKGELQLPTKGWVRRVTDECYRTSELSEVTKINSDCRQTIPEVNDMFSKKLDRTQLLQKCLKILYVIPCLSVLE